MQNDKAKLGAGGAGVREAPCFQGAAEASFLSRCQLHSLAVAPQKRNFFVFKDSSCESRNTAASPHEDAASTAGRSMRQNHYRRYSVCWPMARPSACAPAWRRSPARACISRLVPGRVLGWHTPSMCWLLRGGREDWMDGTIPSLHLRRAITSPPTRYWENTTNKTTETRYATRRLAANKTSQATGPAHLGQLRLFLSLLGQCLGPASLRGIGPRSSLCRSHSKRHDGTPARAQSTMEGLHLELDCNRPWRLWMMNGRSR